MGKTEKREKAGIDTRDKRRVYATRTRTALEAYGLIYRLYRGKFFAIDDQKSSLFIELPFFRPWITRSNSL